VSESGDGSGFDEREWVKEEGSERKENGPKKEAGGEPLPPKAGEKP
jgi:hypothetical protein